MDAVRETNRFLQQHAPWQLQGDPQRKAAVLGVALKGLRLSAELLQPVIPTSADQVLAYLGASSNESSSESGCPGLHGRAICGIDAADSQGCFCGCTASLSTTGEEGFRNPT